MFVHCFFVLSTLPWCASYIQDIQCMLLQELKTLVQPTQILDLFLYTNIERVVGLNGSR